MTGSDKCYRKIQSSIREKGMTMGTDKGRTLIKVTFEQRSEGNGVCHADSWVGKDKYSGYLEEQVQRL